jgi:hypothetical protein
VEEDDVKNLSKKFFVNENSTAIWMTIFDTAAWPTSHQLQNGSFQTTAQRALTNQPTNNQTAKGGNVLFAQISAYVLWSD